VAAAARRDGSKGKGSAREEDHGELEILVLLSRVLDFHENRSNSEKLGGF
jgi:hypothetical protein